MHRIVRFIACLTLVNASFSNGHVAQAQEIESTSESISAELIEVERSDTFDETDIAASAAWAQSLGIADWLGPLAPIALSPFFGVMCLSGLSLWGPQWVTDNELLGSSGPLQNEAIFFIFLALALLTSLPRLTKVSKPFAQAFDRLEAYAVIVILLVVKIVSSMESSGLESSGEPEVAMIQLGIFSFTADTLLAIAMVINILIVNSVKFFFEFLVWLTPIPFLDAIFELCNKATCGVLLAIYAFSPTVATVLNLIVLLFAAIAFRWVSRRVRFYRAMVLDPLLARVWSGYGEAKSAELIVFPKADLGPFQAKSRLRLKRDGDSGWVLKEANWWMPSKQYKLSPSPQPLVIRGWVMNRIDIDGNQLLFS